MNVSHSHKLCWFAPGRCASRTIGDLFWNQLQFVNIVENTAENHTHQILYDHEKYRDYKIIMCVRNPYSLVLSTWRLSVEDHELDEKTYSFDFYVKNAASAFQFFDKTIYEVIQKRQIDYLIHYESLLEDLLKLPFFDKEQTVQTITAHNYASKLERNSKGLADTSKYYTPELADIVYNRCEWYFTSFGYARESY